MTARPSPCQTVIIAVWFIGMVWLAWRNNHLPPAAPPVDAAALVEQATAAAEARHAEDLARIEREHADETARIQADADARVAAVGADRERLAVRLDRERQRQRTAPAPERTEELRQRLGVPDVDCADTTDGPGDPPRCVLGARASETVLTLTLEAEAAPERERLAVEEARANLDRAWAIRLADATARAAGEAARMERSIALRTAERDAARAELAAAESAPGFWEGFAWGLGTGALAASAATAGVLIATR